MFVVPFVSLLIANSSLMPNMFFPFITGKAIVFRFLVQIAAAAWLILALKQPEYRPRRGGIIIVLMSFLVVLGISTVLAENPLKSFWSNFERMEGYITVLHLAIYSLVLSSVLTTEKMWRRFFNASLIANAIILVYALLQWFGEVEIHQGANRLTSSLGNASYLAVYVLVHIFLITYLFFTTPKQLKLYRWLLGVSFVVNLFVLFNTGTRGTLLGLVGGAAVSLAVIFFTFRGHQQLHRWVGVVLVAGLVLVASFLFLRTTDYVKSHPVLSRYASISYQDALPRLTVWQMALKGAAERPVFGWGQENFNYVFNKYFDPKMETQEEWFDRAHNVFMDWLIAGGVLALAAYLALFGALVYRFYRERRGQPVLFAVVAGLLTSYFIHNLFVFDHLASYILFFTLIGFGIYHERQARTVAPGKPLNSRLVPVAIIIVLVLFVSVSYAATFRPAGGARGIIAAISPNQLSPRSNLATFEKLLADGPAFSKPEIRERLFEYTFQVLADPKAPADIKQKLVEFTADQLKLQTEVTPNDARYHYFEGLFWQNIGDQGKAIKSLERALELSPKKQHIMFAIGHSYLAMGSELKSIEYFRRAYELDPNLDRPRVNYAVSLMYAGQQAAADKLLVEGFGSVITQSSELLNAYVTLKMYDRVLLYWQAEVKADPKNPDRHLSLAAAYLFVGRGEQAIIEIQEAMELKPEFKAQGQYLISEIRAGRNPVK
jgi:O-antigen ligase/tetratricopeptide (TPR) repeat protein